MLQTRFTQDCGHARGFSAGARARIQARRATVPPTVALKCQHNYFTGPEWVYHHRHPRFSLLHTSSATATESERSRKNNKKETMEAKRKPIITNKARHLLTGSVYSCFLTLHHLKGEYHEVMWLTHCLPLIRRVDLRCHVCDHHGDGRQVCGLSRTEVWWERSEYLKRFENPPVCPQHMTHGPLLHILAAKKNTRWN